MGKLWKERDLDMYYDLNDKPKKRNYGIIKCKKCEKKMVKTNFNHMYCKACKKIVMREYQREWYWKEKNKRIRICQILSKKDSDKQDKKPIFPLMKQPIY